MKHFWCLVQCSVIDCAAFCPLSLPKRNTLNFVFSFLVALRDREYKDFNDSLNTKVKLNLYKSFCKEIEFKNYLQGVGDPGTRLLFKFRSGTNGLNEELGRHRGKNDDRQCKLCRGECESVVHVLWECPAYDSIRNNFMVELENLLGGGLGSSVHLIILIRQVLF